GADHEEVAVRQVDDVEQAEDDGKAERDQRDDQPPDQPVHGQQEELVHHVIVARGSSSIMCRSMRRSFGERPSARPTSCGRCNTGISSFWPMSFSISRWKPSSTVWQSGQGVTMALAPLILADWMCCPVSLMAIRSS